MRVTNFEGRRPDLGNFHPELLGEFARHSLQIGFPRFALASWEFPEAPVPLVGRALADQVPLLLVGNRGENPDQSSRWWCGLSAHVAPKQVALTGRGVAVRPTTAYPQMGPGASPRAQEEIES